MKKNKRFLIFLLFMLFVSCKKETKDENIQEITPKIKNIQLPEISMNQAENSREKFIHEDARYEPITNAKKFKQEKPLNINVKIPGGLACRKTDWFLCDTGANKILQLNYEGKIIQEWSEWKGENERFNRPTDIQIIKNEIYVLDSGNQRILIFDQNFKPLHEISYCKELAKPNDEMMSMAVVDQNNIYLSQFYGATGKILYYDGKSISSIGNNFYGSLTYDDEFVYAANIGQKLKGKKNGVITSNCYLWKMKGRKVKEMKEIDYGTTPSGLIKEEANATMYSASRGMIVNYLKGERFQFSWLMDDNYGFFSYMKKTPDGDYILSAPSKRKVIELIR